VPCFASVERCSCPVRAAAVTRGDWDGGGTHVCSLKRALLADVRRPQILTVRAARLSHFAGGRPG